jgi:alkaline phosphatase
MCAGLLVGVVLLREAYAAPADPGTAAGREAWPGVPAPPIMPQKPHPHPRPRPPAARNVIVMIVDGGGFNHLLAADYFESGSAGAQVFASFPVQLAVSTCPAGGSYDSAAAWSSFPYVLGGVTDSAAAATALSTGSKTSNGALGVDPGGQPLMHAAERAEARGKATGVVTSVSWTHATPAGFSVHVASRGDIATIAGQMIEESGLDVVLGAGNPGFDDDGAPLAVPAYDAVDASTWAGLVAGTAGGDADGDGVADPWTLIQSKADFAALALAGDPPARVCGTVTAHTTLQQDRSGDRQAAPFTVPLTTTVPDLATMTRGALNVLDGDPDGFFLMVEGGAVDWAAHGGQKGRLIEEELAFGDAVESVVAWVEANSSWGETLVIVTSDHETGYLWGSGSDPGWTSVENNGAGVLPGMQFNTTGHTNSLVPLFAKGRGAYLLRRTAAGRDPLRGAYLDNTDVGRLVGRATLPAARP